MSCSRGKATPNSHTTLRLFADSGGFCQNPDCLRGLFIDAGSEHLHIAEMAHVFSASDEGPRAKPSLSSAERGAYENLILLCPCCHTIIDKAPKEFPDHLVFEWKKEHKERIASAFGAITYPERQSVRSAIDPLLAENNAIFETYGPLQEYRFNPESEMAEVWRRKVLSSILPNNRKILSILDANRRHLIGNESTVLENFRQHVDDLEARHIGGVATGGGMRFPDEMNAIFGDK